MMRTIDKVKYVFAATALSCLATAAGQSSFFSLVSHAQATSSFDTDLQAAVDLANEKKLVEALTIIDQYVGQDRLGLDDQLRVTLLKVQILERQGDYIGALSFLNEAPDEHVNRLRDAKRINFDEIAEFARVQSTNNFTAWEMALALAFERAKARTNANELSRAYDALSDAVAKTDETQLQLADYRMRIALGMQRYDLAGRAADRILSVAGENLEVDVRRQLQETVSAGVAVSQQIESIKETSEQISIQHIEILEDGKIGWDQLGSSYFTPEGDIIAISTTKSAPTRQVSEISLVDRAGKITPIESFRHLDWTGLKSVKGADGTLVFYVPRTSKERADGVKVQILSYDPKWKQSRYISFQPDPEMSIDSITTTVDGRLIVVNHKTDQNRPNRYRIHEYRPGQSSWQQTILDSDCWSAPAIAARSDGNLAALCTAPTEDGGKSKILTVGKTGEVLTTYQSELSHLSRGIQIVEGHGFLVAEQGKRNFVLLSFQGEVLKRFEEVPVDFRLNSNVTLQRALDQELYVTYERRAVANNSVDRCFILADSTESLKQSPLCLRTGGTTRYSKNRKFQAVLLPTAGSFWEFAIAEIGGATADSSLLPFEFELKGANILATNEGGAFLVAYADSDFFDVTRGRHSNKIVVAYINSDGKLKWYKELTPKSNSSSARVQNFSLTQNGELAMAWFTETLSLERTSFKLSVFPPAD